MPDYKVIVEGTTLAGFDRAAVVQKLALLTKQSEETANRLLFGQPTIVKARVDQPTALHYQNAFRTIGAAARIEELEVLIIDIPDAPLSPADAAPPGVSATSVPSALQNEGARTDSRTATNTASQGFRSAVQSQGGASKSSGVSWDLASSLLVFALLFSWLIFGAITQLLSGAIDGNVFRFAAGLSFAVAAITAGIFYVISYNVLQVSLVKRLASEHRPGKNFLALAAGLLIAAIVVGVFNSYYKGEQLKVEAKRNEEAAKAKAVTLKAQQDHQRAEIERTKAEGEARDAALAAKFATERGGIIAKLKQLSAARNYQEVINIGNGYAWAKDRELDALVNAAKEETRIALASKGQWHYGTALDKISNKPKIWNQLESDNSVQYGFPYGNQKMTLTVRKAPSDGTSVYISMQEGQLICDISNGCSVKVKFDNLPAMSFTGRPPTDYSSNALFLMPEEKFIANLRKSKSAVIEVVFYQHGAVQYEFTTGGFEWK